MKSDDRRAVMLWTQDLRGRETPPASWLDLLGEDERSHCRRFRHDQDRLAYAAAHVLLRSALGRTLGLPPGELVFARDAMGKPFLSAPGQETIEFSLSHTTGMVAVAISRAGKVGVDVEAMDRKVVPDRDLVAFGLSPEEAAHLAALPEPGRCEAFVELWTAREAVAKAEGRGLSLPFGRIRIDRSGNFATVAPDEARPARNWRLWRERPTSGHRLALAAAENGHLIRMDALL